MHLLASWFTALTAQLAALLANRTLAVVIWAGMAALTIALMILMRTRWGQVKPLSKCVVLSVFAHVLLLAYAYSTRLCQQQPGVDADDVVQLAFVASDAPPGDPEQQNLDERPWERLAEDHSVPPEPVELERAPVDAGDVARSTQADPSPVPDVFIPPDALPAAEPTRPEVEPLPPGPVTPGRSRVGATAIEIPQPERPADTAPAVPEPPAPDRMRPAPAPVSRHPHPPNPSPLPTEIADVGAQVQAMADVEARAEVADARPSPLDHTAEAENRGSSHNPGVSEPRSGSDHNQSLVALPPLWRPPAATSPAAPITIEQLIDNPSHRVGDGQPVPATLRLRYAPQRQQLAEQLGSSAKSAAAVEAALAWLAAQQERDGRWDADRWGAGMEMRVGGHDREGAGTNADTAVTGLAVLAFLASGHTHLEGTYRQNVQRALEFLLGSQAADGDLAGRARLYARMYSHGIASLALSEALALTGDLRIEPGVQRAVQFTVNAQHATTGGWRYQPKDPGDMSQFGWQVMALKSASLAGVPTPQKTREGMLHFLQLCELGQHGGLASYRPGEKPSRSMTAEALASRYFLDLAPSDAMVAEATDYVLGELPQPGIPNLYYWYYGTLAMFHVQGPAWTRWNEAMQRELLRLQRTDGHLAGSWDANTVWGTYGGRIYSTAMATLCLEVYYRYLPLTALKDGSLRSPVRAARRDTLHLPW